MRWQFSQKKMLALPEKRQHKNCAEMLRDLHACPENVSLLTHYNEIQQWLGLPKLEAATAEAISNRYHRHLKQANSQLKEHHLLPNIRRHDRTTAPAPWPIAVYLDNLRSAHNVGSIIRTVEAFSLGTIFLGGSTPGPENKQVRDTAMGTFEWVTLRRDVPLENLPSPIVVMETVEEALPITDYEFPEQFTLVVGNEEFGCSEKMVEKGNVFVEIPLRGRKNSLNVANAVAIAAAEIARQRQKEVGAGPA